MAVTFVGTFLTADGVWSRSSTANYVYIPKKFPTIEIGAWGFIDKQGQYVINPQFNAGACFKNGLATVRYGEGTACNNKIVIDRKGNRVMPPDKVAGGDESHKIIAPPLLFMTTDVARLGEFLDGVAIRSVMTLRLVPGWGGWNGLLQPILLDEGQRFYLVDKSGTTIKELPGEPIGKKFSEGLLPVRIGSKIGFVDTKGDLVIKNQYDNALSFDGGLVWVAKNSGFTPVWGCVNRAGAIVIPCIYTTLREFHDERAFVTLLNKKQGFIDKAGHMVITQDLDTTYNDFSEDVATFETQYTHGFIDKSGKIICTLNCLHIGNFREGLCAVRTDKGVGFVDKRGKWVIQPKYRFASDFSEGLAAVCDFEEHQAKQQVEEVEALKKRALKQAMKIPVIYADIDYNPGREGHEN